MSRAVYILSNRHKDRYLGPPSPPPPLSGVPSDEGSFEQSPGIWMPKFECRGDEYVASRVDLGTLER